MSPLLCGSGVVVLSTACWYWEVLFLAIHEFSSKTFKVNGKKSIDFEPASRNLRPNNVFKFPFRSVRTGSTLSCLRCHLSLNVYRCHTTTNHQITSTNWIGLTNLSTLQVSIRRGISHFQCILVHKHFRETHFQILKENERRWRWCWRLKRWRKKRIPFCCPANREFLKRMNILMMTWMSSMMAMLMTLMVLTFLFNFFLFFFSADQLLFLSIMLCFLFSFPLL